MRIAPAYPLQIFYDGSCSVCAREMEVYRRKEHEGRLTFVDISAADFRPEVYGIPLQAFMREMHAIDRNDRVYRGVDAFSAIWQAFPADIRYRFLAGFVHLPGASLVAHLLYHAFARVRKYLPRSSGACANGVCGLGRKGP